MHSLPGDTVIKTILFDADGVIQRTAAGWQDELVALLEDRSEEDGVRFLEAIRDAEVPTMDGTADIVTAIGSVLSEFEVRADVSDVLELWTRIEPDETMVAAVEQLRQDGVTCCLATNQQSRRAAWMRHHLGYDETFDEQFYSCELGLAKPDPAYFRAILERTGTEAPSVLFVDDTAANIEGARSVGVNAQLFPRHGGEAALKEILNRYRVQGN